MAYGDYITCCKCDVKLIFDGDRGQRQWWAERFGKEPEIECPNCKAEWVGLTDGEMVDLLKECEGRLWVDGFRAIEAKLKEKNT
jgi:hypothetical protein